MEGRENVGERLCSRAMFRALFPGDCGFKSITGGALKNLRESTTNEKVRQYHKQFYRPENLNLIIAGKIEVDAVLQTVASVDEKIISKGSRSPFTRPWQTPVSALTEPVDLKVVYPSDEENNGIVAMAWRTSSGNKDVYKTHACRMLMKYFTTTSTSPIQKHFIETEDPYASEVSYTISEYGELMFGLDFSDVPIPKVDLVKDHVLEFLADFASGNRKLEMDRIRTVIHRTEQQWLFTLQNDPESCVPAIVDHALYSKTDSELETRLDVLGTLKSLKSEPEEFWVELLQQYVVNNPCVTIRGYPSLQEKQILSQREEQRIAQQREALGTVGLERLGKELEQAVAENKITPPSEVLTMIPVPSIENIIFHPRQCFSTDSEFQHPNFDLSEVPFQMHVCNISTKFVHMTVLVDTSELSSDERLYLPVIIGAVMLQSVRRGGALVPYEEFVEEIERNTISIYFHIGIGESYLQCAYFEIKVEQSKYEFVVKLFKEFLYETQFTPDRTRVIVKNYIVSGADAKRSGGAVLSFLTDGLLFNKDSNHYVCSTLRQQKFLPTLLAKLDSPDECSNILDDIESTRQKLFDPANIVIHMGANIEEMASEIGDLSQPWKQLLPDDKVPARHRLSVPPDSTFLLEPSESSNESCVVGISSMENSLLSQTTPCITDIYDEDLARLAVLTQYLTQSEGPLWKRIRGLGLSYGLSLSAAVQKGLLFFSLSYASDCVLAYKEAKNTVMSLINGEAPWDQTLFEAAQTTIIGEVIENEKDVDSVIEQSVLSCFRSDDRDYNRWLLKMVSEVKFEDMAEMCSKYVAPLFDPQKVKTAIVCQPSEVNNIAQGFREMGHELSVHETVDDSFLDTWF